MAGGDYISRIVAPRLSQLQALMSTATETRTNPGKNRVC
jgi:hypothetical protein